MELRHLRYFVAVAEEENVTRAAARLHISQPGVSRQIRDLEDELGVPLLEHGAKAVRLTEAGRVFLGEARAVLARAEKAVTEVRAVALGTSGEIRVGYAPSLTVQVLPATLRRFQGQYPGVKVTLHDLSSGEMVSQLHEGSLHVALGAPPHLAQRRGLEIRKIARCSICVAVPRSHPLTKVRLKDGGLPANRLAGEHLIGYSRTEYPEYHESLALVFGSAEAVPRIAEEHESVTSLIAAVEAGRGVAIVASALACLSGPRLKLIRIVPAPPEIIVAAMWKRGSSHAATQHFVEMAFEAAKPDSGGAL